MTVPTRFETKVKSEYQRAKRQLDESGDHLAYGAWQHDESKFLERLLVLQLDTYRRLVKEDYHPHDALLNATSATELYIDTEL